MNRRFLPLIIGSLLLPLGWGCNDDPTGPTDPFCSSQPASAIVTFEDALLEAAIRGALGIGTGEDLTCHLISGLTVLNAHNIGIERLVGIQNLTNLTLLNLRLNNITDISVLSGLTNLDFLDLQHNLITDISALSELTNLRSLGLGSNPITDLSALSGLTNLRELRLHSSFDPNPYPITDISPLSGLTSLTILDLSNNTGLSNIQPLLDNTGLGAGDTVLLNNTNVNCTDVAALEAKGVTVVSDCP